jgi:hypothetical protein
MICVGVPIASIITLRVVVLWRKTGPVWQGMRVTLDSAVLALMPALTYWPLSEVDVDTTGPCSRYGAGTAHTK